MTRAAQVAIALQSRRRRADMPDLQAIVRDGMRRYCTVGESVQDSLKAAKQYIDRFRTDAGRERATTAMSRQIRELEMAHRRDVLDPGRLTVKTNQRWGYAGR